MDDMTLGVLDPDPVNPSLKMVQIPARGSGGGGEPLTEVSHTDSSGNKQLFGGAIGDVCRVGNRVYGFTPDTFPPKRNRPLTSELPAVLALV